MFEKTFEKILNDGSRALPLARAPLALALAGALASAAGCMTESDEPLEAETSTAAADVQVCREVQHFGYTYAGSSYNWDVTTEFGTGRQFVDERRVGGGFYRQYRVSPVWSYCPHANEWVTLINP